MAEKASIGLGIGLSFVACILFAAIIDAIETYASEFLSILLLGTLIASTIGLRKWYRALIRDSDNRRREEEDRRRQLERAWNTERVRLETLAANARRSAQKLQECTTSHIVVLDSNIWMDSAYEELFDGYSHLVKSVHLCKLSMPSAQYEEIEAIKNRTKFGEPKNQRARLALERIEVFQKNHLLAISNLAKTAKSGPYVDPILIQMAARAAATLQKFTLITDDRDMRIRCREQVKGQPGADGIYISEGPEFNGLIRDVQAGVGACLRWPDFIPSPASPYVQPKLPIPSRPNPVFKIMCLLLLLAVFPASYWISAPWIKHWCTSPSEITVGRVVSVPYDTPRGIWPFTWTETNYRNETVAAKDTIYSVNILQFWALESVTIAILVGLYGWWVFSMRRELESTNLSATEK